jgi:hypothetical protein
MHLSVENNKLRTRPMGRQIEYITAFFEFR